jgi:hypothetical protein
MADDDNNRHDDEDHKKLLNGIELDKQKAASYRTTAFWRLGFLIVHKAAPINAAPVICNMLSSDFVYCHHCCQQQISGVLFELLYFR